VVSYAAVKFRKTAPVFSVFSNPFSMIAVWGCDLVAGAAATAGMQYDAFQQLVAYAQERYGWTTCSKLWIFARFCFSPDLWDSLFLNHSGEEMG